MKIKRLAPKFQVLTWHVGHGTEDWSMCTPGDLPDLVFAMMRWCADKSGKIVKL